MSKNKSKHHNKKRVNKRQPLRAVDYSQNAINEQNKPKILRALDKAERKYGVKLDRSFKQGIDGEVLNVVANGRSWFLVVDEINGRIYRKDHNISNGQKMHFHSDRSYSNWFQASESLATTHNPHYWK